MNYLKTNHTWARQRGTTLIELSVVIAVILLLVGVLFIGVKAWQDGANKAACIVNQSSIQKAVRGYANINQIPVGAAIVEGDLTGAGFFAAGAFPKCPVGPTAYNELGTNPTVGQEWATCAAKRCQLVV
jgi:prepilin-type N-terminal cleavage/methylation domain-containing protein